MSLTNKKQVELKSISHEKPTTKYNLRSRNASKKQEESFFTVSPKRRRKNTSKKQEDPKQKKIDSFFTVSPKRKIIESTQETPAKKLKDSPSKDLYLSPSERLNYLVPKVEDILRARENEEKFKKIQAIIKISSKRFLDDLEKCSTDDNVNVDSGSSKSNIIKYKDCKHLTNVQLTYRFKKSIGFIDDIFYGRVWNERYELFKKDSLLNNGTKKDLRINDTNVAFTQDQQIHIVSLFRERYDQGNIYKYSDLYFKVLLPELCLKIFSDVHKMTPSAALMYLKAVPVRDIF